ncbi:MAG: DNA polymerase III subunit alpha [Deferribacteres bacterium]|nr:DNA polymerase III subunit alpha [Deferribacteres bacterium]
MQSFIHLHIHSNYSFCRGGNTQEEICTRLKDHGHSIFAFTEIDGLHGMVWAQQAARKAGLRCIVGAELRTKNNGRVVLLVKDVQGYRNLSQLISQKRAIDLEGTTANSNSSPAASGLENFDSSPKASRHENFNPSPKASRRGQHIERSAGRFRSSIQDEEQATGLAKATPENDYRHFMLHTVQQFRSGLVILSDSHVLLQNLRQHSRDDLYVLCIPGPQRHAMLRLARQMALPPVASNDVYFVDAEDYHTHKILRAIDCNTALSRIPHNELARRDAWLKSPQQMADAFPDCPQALANTVRIAESCQFQPENPGAIFPRVALPEGKSDIQHLRELCEKKIPWRYKQKTPEITKRLEKELAIIGEKGFAAYFLVSRDIVQHATRTCGRGSAAASLVSYLLGITHVDPIGYNLYFERFLHRERMDPPDIDIDFAWDERDDVLDYIFDHYGESHTAMIANHVCFKGRAALREIAKCYGLPDAEIGRISKKLSGYSVHNISKTIETHPVFRGLQLDEPWPEIIQLAERINGFPRNISVHCGGVVITPQPIADYIPVEKAPKGVQIVQVEKDQAEELGLVKLDILGNRSLAVIRDAVAAVKRNTGRDIDFNEVKPELDPATQELIKTGDTIGVFYVESPAMRQLQRKAKTGDFEHLVIHSSLIRPAANAFNREYLRRLHGGDWQPLHPSVEEILKETYGIMCYQEDVSRVAIALAGFTESQGDGLRKVFNKKNNAERVAQYQHDFYTGALDNGVAPETITKIWNMILSFSGYSFCKPHSASYAMVSFKSAWLRAHYPAEFIAAVLTNQGGYYSAFAYISEAKRMGIEIQPLDINHSAKEYTGVGKKLRIGFMQVKGLNENALSALLQERQENGLYGSFDDFMQRTQTLPAMAEILVKAGAFDKLETMERRPQLLWRIAREKAALARPKPQAMQASLFDEIADTGPSLHESRNKPQPPSLLSFDLKTILSQEIETLGFLVSRHPLTFYKHRAEARKVVPAKDLALYVGKRVRTLGWFVTGKLARTKKEEPMEFISFEDTTAIYETTFFPQAYEKYCHLLSHSQPYILTGKVEEDFGAVALTVEGVEKME